jgi:uncharacterized protein YbaP (TraB family)
MSQLEEQYKNSGSVVVEYEEENEDMYSTSDASEEYIEYVSCDPIIINSLRVVPVLVSEDIETENEKEA